MALNNLALSVICKPNNFLTYLVTRSVERPKCFTVKKYTKLGGTFKLGYLLFFPKIHYFLGFLTDFLSNCYMCTHIYAITSEHHNSIIYHYELSVFFPTICTFSEGFRFLSLDSKYLHIIFN